MEIVEIFERKEYRMFFIFFLINFTTIFLISDYMPDKFPVISYRISLTALVSYNIYCIFIRSSFDNIYIQILQLKLKILNPYFASFIGLVSTAITFLFYIILIYLYIDYKLKCPFLLKNFDLNIHAQRRCELYNFNSTSIFPYQYICSYNPGETKERICSKIGQIIKKNEIVDTFLNEYYKETNLYYCDLKEEPSLFIEVNPKLCDEKVPELLLYFRALIILNIIIGIICISNIYTYFRNIEPNINHFIAIEPNINNYELLHSL